MKKLTLTNSAQNNTTVLENEFIDQYMIKANGEYVKVYLLLLRHQNEASTSWHLSDRRHFRGDGKRCDPCVKLLEQTRTLRI